MCILLIKDKKYGSKPSLTTLFSALFVFLRKLFHVKCTIISHYFANHLTSYAH